MFRTREEYRVYTDHFRDRNYDAVLDYFAPDHEFEIEFFGTKKTTREEFLKFYNFFHDYVVEEVICNEFSAAENMAAVEVFIRVTAKKDLTREDGAAAGFHIEYPIKKGERIDSPQFAHYYFNAGGKIRAVRSALFEPAKGDKT